MKSECLKQSNCETINAELATVNIFTPKKPLKLEAVASLKNTKSTKYSARSTVYQKTGCIVANKVAKTLQGSIYLGKDSNNNRVIIKRTDKKLHKSKVALINHKYVRCTENIIKEAKLLKSIHDKNPPKGFIKYIDFVSDDKNYFLIMEYGGESLFKYAKQMHELISKKLLSITEWKKHIKILFKQMSICIFWLHKIMKLAHFDISLENITIKGVEIKNGKFIKHGQIYFIDFGLSKSFENNSLCKHYVGKKLYQSPKIVNKTPFNASKADIWCMGICLFMLSLGVAPFNAPKNTDPHFSNIMHGYLERMLQDLNKTKFISDDLISLLNAILCNEDKRISIDELLKHKYLN